MSLTIDQAKEDIATRLSSQANLFSLYSKQSIKRNMTVWPQPKSHTVYIDVDTVCSNIGPIRWSKETLERVKRSILEDNINRQSYGTITLWDDRTLRICVKEVI